MTSPSATQTHVVGSDAVIAVRTTAADIRIRGVAGDSAAVRLVGGDLLESYTVKATTGRLEVRPISRTPFDLLRDPGPLELDVPIGATLQIESTSGSVQVLDVVGPGTYGTVSGDLQLVGVVGQVSAETVSGDAKVRAAGLISIGLQTVSGDIDVVAPTVDRSEMKTMSGDVRLVSQLWGDGPFAAETVSGDVILQIDGPARFQAQTMSGDIRAGRTGVIETKRGSSVLVGPAGPLFAVRTLSGDIRLPDQEQQSAPTRRSTTPSASIVPTAPPPPPAPAAPLAPPALQSSPEPAAPIFEAMSASVADVAADVAADDPELEILRSLEAGDIDIVEAERRFATMEGSGRVRIA